MTTIMFPFLSGVLQAGIFVLLTRTWGGRHALSLHVALLLLAGILYVIFAARMGAWAGVAIELLGTLVLAAAALHTLLRCTTGMLALAWALHPVWDIALHTRGLGSYTPDGYVVACIGFDLLLAALIVRGWAGVPAAASALRAQAAR